MHICTHMCKNIDQGALLAWIFLSLTSFLSAITPVHNPDHILRLLCEMLYVCSCLLPNTDTTFRKGP